MNTLLILTLSTWACSPVESERDQAVVAPKQNTAPPKQTGMRSTAPATVPNFASIKDVKERKKRFFAFLQPLVLAENTRLREQRRRILKLHDIFQKGKGLSKPDREWLKEICETYHISPADPPSKEIFQKLLRRVDIIPLELALAQAAIESAWGSSRFARKGNNLFGQWCYEKGCGIVPKHRPAGAKHEVAIFHSPVHSVRSYIKNLNTHSAYRPLRDLRYETRLKGKQPNGHALAPGLIKYASIRMEYVKKVRTVISQNKHLIPVQGNQAASFPESSR